MPVTVDFTVIHDLKHLTSTQALERITSLYGSFKRPWDLEGVLTISDDDLEDVCWHDTLVPLLSAVCLEALPVLASGGHSAAIRTAEYGYLRMDVEGAWIRLGGDWLPSGRVEREPLLHALLGAVGRLIDLLLALDLDGFDVRALREDRSLAIRAIGQAKWSTDGAMNLPPIGPSPPREEGEGEVTLTPDGQLGWRCGSRAVLLPGDRSAWRTVVEQRVLPSLRDGRSVVVSHPTAYGYARFDWEGDRVRISGDGMADLRLPLDGVLRSLVE